MLNGKVAIVTGSTSGIGLGIAKAMAEAGCRVVLNGRRLNDEAQAILDSLPKETGAEVMFGAADMAEPDQIHDMVGNVIDKWGGCDILVNNAGIQHVQPIHEFPTEKWDQVIAINMSSAFHTTKAALPSMKKKGWGRIINVASAHGLVASAYKSAYVAAKHGVVGLTKVTALEVAEEGITCNAICPGYVWTPLVEKQIPDQAREHKMSEADVIRNVLLVNQPTKKFATTDEIGALAVFLSTDSAASITGTTLPVDGGWTAR